MRVKRTAIDEEAHARHAQCELARALRARLARVFEQAGKYGE